jgi:hypothetical protein
MSPIQVFWQDHEMRVHVPAWSRSALSSFRSTRRCFHMLYSTPENNSCLAYPHMLYVFHVHKFTQILFRMKGRKDTPCQ